MDAVLITGAAGFIGFHVARRLLESGCRVVGLDDLNPYYDVALKQARISEIESASGFTFVEADIADAAALDRVFAEHRPDTVIHLAAQAGVRHSLEAPFAYARSNVTGFLTVLEACRRHGIEHLVFASSSSVYGANTQVPYSVHEAADHPVSLYAATKKANEAMAHSYSHLFRIPTTGLRFFTVYGPWGRPDMALFLFTRAILAGEPIRVFNEGDVVRDFTYIDDVAESVARIAARPSAPNPRWNGDAPDPASSPAPFRLYNIGNDRPVSVLRLIELLEHTLGCKARCEMLPMQPGDMRRTSADMSDVERDFGFIPSTPLEEGVGRFVHWYRRFYKV